MGSAESPPQRGQKRGGGVVRLHAWREPSASALGCSLKGGLVKEDKSRKFIWWRPVLGFVISLGFVAGILFVSAVWGLAPPATEAVEPAMEQEIRLELSKFWRPEELSKDPSIWNWDDGGTLTKLKQKPNHLGFRVTDMTGERRVYQVDHAGRSYALRAKDHLQLTWGLTEISKGPR